jgi:enoyl-CoA hydratase/carnithine racemase
MIDSENHGRVRVLTLNRPEALNAFNEALYDAATKALIAAAADRGVAVVVLTARGRAFSAGADLLEMAAGNAGTLQRGEHGFPGFMDQLIAFPKPLLCAVNGIGLGVGATLLGYADLVFMSTEARLKCPFTSLGVAPEAGSSVTFPRLLGRQDASWALMSSEWLSAEQCREMGLAWKVCAPDELLATTLEYAQVLASKPISSLIEVKQTIVEPLRDEIAAARERENAAFARLLGRPANVEALQAFAEKREPDFTAID